ncbi:unnamed protein product [Taenia asiatica]|uniref:Uncharacterized protein n=1 Tax=Taenia asiatica TaxID=60517 RepID=A0A0R3VZ17_TAEAS|nr:unnamed protein product [Taenia asiatica]
MGVAFTHLQEGTLEIIVNEEKQFCVADSSIIIITVVAVVERRCRTPLFLSLPHTDEHAQLGCVLQFI